MADYMPEKYLLPVFKILFLKKKYVKLYFAVPLPRGGVNMSAKCVICRKEKASGFKVSHSHIRTKRSWKPNIQKIRILINGTPQQIKICTRCLKAGRVKRAI